MECFKELGLTDAATVEMVKSAWRQLASVHHPDRGGNAAEFSRVHKYYLEALAYASAPKSCLSCEGSGKVLRGLGFQQVKINCPSCGGTGVKE